MEMNIDKIVEEYHEACGPCGTISPNIGKSAVL